jgi:hypothetical protein
LPGLRPKKDGPQRSSCCCLLLFSILPRRVWGPAIMNAGGLWAALLTPPSIRSLKISQDQSRVCSVTRRMWEWGVGGGGACIIGGGGRLDRAARCTRQDPGAQAHGASGAC